MARQNSGPLPPVLPTTGLITSGPISSGPLNSSGAPRKVSGPLDSAASLKMRATSFAHNQAVSNLNTEDGYSIQGSFPKPILWAVILLFVMGFIAGGFILGAVHNAILLIVVVVIFGFVAALLIWNACWGRRGAIGFVNRYPDTDLRTAKDGQYVKVTGVDHGRDETRLQAGEADAATRKRSLEAGELLVARKHGAASVAGRRREMEDAVSVREAFALAEGSHGGRRDFYSPRTSLSPPPTSPGPREAFALAEGSHGGRRDFYGMHELLAEELAVAADDVSWTAAMERATAR